MEKWREGARFGQINEPHDVTVQMDGLGRELPGPGPASGPGSGSGPGAGSGPSPSPGPGPVRGSLTRGGEVRDAHGVREVLGSGPGEPSRSGESPGAGGSAGPDGGDVPPVTDSPVFVDASGRRGRKYRRIGWVLAFACASYAVLLVFTVVGGSSTAPWLLIPGPATGKKADTARTPARPVVSPAPGQGIPGATPAPVPVDVASTGAPEQATAVAHGVRVTPPGARSAPPGKAAKSGKARKPAPPVRAPGGGSTHPAPVVSAPPSGGGRTPSPSAPAPSDSATAPTGPGPEQSAFPESAP